MKIGSYSITWLDGRSESASEETGRHRVPYRPGSLLLSDLIVRVGDGGVGTQGSAGQPYFLTLAS